MAEARVVKFFAIVGYTKRYHSVN